MKKIPPIEQLQQDKSGVEADADPVPMMPGTETPRSLGDIIRTAEAAQSADKQSDTETENHSPVRAKRSKGGKSVSRAKARRYARQRALQALYQWDLSQGQTSTIRQEFLANQDMSRVDVDLFTQLFNGVSHNPTVIDTELQMALDRPVEDLDPIERAVLRIAAYELTQCLETPARVIINEGIEITKHFGADKGHRYVNGVLDKLALHVRPLEMQKR